VLLAKEPLELVEKYDLSSLKVLGLLGSPSMKRPGTGTTTMWVRKKALL
jgi:hypothetical protein